jgi:hypothetical protein
MKQEKKFKVLHHMFKKNEIKLQSEAMPLFDVQRWAFDLPAMPCNKAMVSIAILLHNSMLTMTKIICMAGGCSMFICEILRITNN